MQVLAQVVGERDPHRIAKDLLEVQVDAARRAVIVDVRVHVEAGVEEHHERSQPGPVQRQAPLGEERVVHDPLHVDRAHRDPAHVRVAQDVVHVVGGEDAGQQRLEERQPPRMRLQRMRVRLAHEVADPLGIDPLVGGEGAARAAPEAAQDLGQLLADDPLAQQLVGQVEIDQEVVVEEMAERAVADVVEQAGHAQQLLDQRRRGGVGEDRAQRGVELLGEAAGQVHGAQRVLEAAVLGGGKHPAGGLQLRHATQPLHPRRVDQVLLGGLAGNDAGPRVDDVLVDRIGDQAAALIRVGGALHGSECIRARPGTAGAGRSSAR